MRERKKKKGIVSRLHTIASSYISACILENIVDASPRSPDIVFVPSPPTCDVGLGLAPTNRVTKNQRRMHAREQI